MTRSLSGNASRGEIPVITVDDDVGDDPSIRNSPSHSEVIMFVSHLHVTQLSVAQERESDMQVNMNCYVRVR